MLSIKSRKCRFQISDDVFLILKAAGEANKTCRDACLLKLLVRQLSVGRCSRVEAAGTGICHMGLYGCHLQALHKTLRGAPAALQTERDNTAAAAGKIFFRQLMESVTLKIRIADIFDLGLLLEEAGRCQAVFTVPGHAHMQGLKSQIQKVCVLRGLDRSKIPHKL